LSQQVDYVTSKLETFVFKVVASAGLEIRVRGKASRETITLTAGHIAQELAFSTRLRVSYPDEFSAALNVVGRTRADEEDDSNQTGDLHIEFWILRRFAWVR
jgi:hypothetical protein